MRAVAGKLIEAGRLGLLPSPFNPPTTAHLALADSAQESFRLDQVAYILPDSLPHKRIERPSVTRRLEWLAALAQRRPDRVVASGPEALVIDIARAFRKRLGPRCDLFVIAGRDAAERYATWDYGRREPFPEQIREFTLLVAARDGRYRVDPEHEGRIRTFEIASSQTRASSSAVRDSIRAGRPWRHMVPRAIQPAVERAYRGTGR